MRLHEAHGWNPELDDHTNEEPVDNSSREELVDAVTQVGGTVHLEMPAPAAGGDVTLYVEIADHLLRAAGLIALGVDDRGEAQFSGPA